MDKRRAPIGNYRGWSMADLVLSLQSHRDIVDTIIKYPDPEMYPELQPDMYEPELPSLDDLRQYAQSHLRQANDIVWEIERRRHLVNLPRVPDREIIPIIKERVSMADVLEWYTEVQYSNRKQMTFRCTLHGDGHDKHPSGVIYTEENRWWCFVCNKGGDVIDAVEQFGKMDKGHAIAKLGEYVGIDTKPIVKPTLPKARGGVVLE